ncbi:hypothetical protein [Lutimonas sp.]|uniref:hypothetical protein n=1 Tax=Lutimonas sp. TaxID=1872403 RepID=UPI003D9BBBBA
MVYRNYFAKKAIILKQVQKNELPEKNAAEVRAYKELDQQGMLTLVMEMKFN